jgi:hypothetical protein
MDIKTAVSATENSRKKIEINFFQLLSKHGC